MKWISVDERAPDEDVEVLAYGAPLEHDGRKTDSFVQVMRYVRFYGRGWGGRLTFVDSVTGDDASSYGYDDFGVTHWMPMPEPPHHEGER